MADQNLADLSHRTRKQIQSIRSALSKNEDRNSLVNTLIACQRLAQWFGKEDQVRWLRQEIDGYELTEEVPEYRRRQVDVYRRGLSRSPTRDTMDVRNPVHELERYLNREFDLVKLGAPSAQPLTYIVSPSEIRNLLSKVEIEALKFVGNLESDIEEETEEAISEDILPFLEEFKRTIDDRLGIIAPVALSCLQEAERTFLSTQYPLGDENYSPLPGSKIALSCIEAFIAIGEAIYDPSTFPGEPAIEREKYINRIFRVVERKREGVTVFGTQVKFLKIKGTYLAFLSDTFSELRRVEDREDEVAEVVETALQKFQEIEARAECPSDDDPHRKLLIHRMNQLRAFNELLQKYKHSPQLVTREDALLMLMNTYLFLGEIVNFEEL